MESAENRFGHLLQPIRELTKNWDIDVASELNDYLEELDEMCITFDGGMIKLNFAEAALLIQGSTCIYSKKVELLYRLVYQTLEYINDRNKKRDKQSTASEKDDSSGTADHDEEDTFKHLETIVSNKTEVTDSNMPVYVVPLPPQSLILPETHEKQRLPLISMKGEILGSHKDFRINTFIPGDDGLILLNLGRAFSNTPGNGQDNSSWAPMDSQAAARSAVIVEREGTEDAGASSVGEDRGNKEGDNFIPMDDNDVEMDNEPEEHIDRHQGPSEGRMLRERQIQPSEEERKNLKREEELQHAKNVWKLHDPYAIIGEDKCLKTGKCYKVLDGLEDAGKRKRKPPPLFQDFRTWYTGLFDPPEQKLKNGPTFTDLNYIYLSKMKDKIKARKRVFRKAGLVVSDEELRCTLLQPEDKESEELRYHALQGADEDLSDTEHEPLPNDMPDVFGGGPDIIAPEGQGDDMSYEDLVKKSVEEFLVNAQGYAQETALSRRIKDWEDKICPELSQQEKRQVFDIHDYGDRIVGSLTTVGHRKSFASIVQGLDNFEACKYMLASLQLANDYTVEIDSVEGLEESMDTMGLTLLSTHRANERFKTLSSA